MLKRKKFIKYKILLNTIITLAICTLMGTSNVQAMTYRDNVVEIRLTATRYSLVKGSFTIESFSITNGQDPDKHISIGQVRAFSATNPGMSFSIGRHGSGTVAKWFTNNFAAKNTTFNHHPGKLNFAFKGTLILELSGGKLGSNKDIYTFKDIAIAQGHSGFSNNWWFGGKNCDYSRFGVVSCKGKSSNGYEVNFSFLRGNSNIVNHINIASINFPPYKTVPLQSKYKGESTKCKWQPYYSCPPYVTYYTRRQRATLKLTVKNNLIYNSIGRLLDTTYATANRTGKAAIFVMGTDGSIYASNLSARYLFHHSSILGGIPVAAAGEMKVTRGVIKKVTTCSGHYKPDQNINKQLTESLKRQGYSRDFDNTTSCLTSRDLQN